MSQDPKTLVALPVYNGASWLPSVLDALQRQTYGNLDIVVWDNASTDETPQIVARYPGMRLIRSNANIGPWAAFEQLFADTDAPFLFACTDVVLDPDYVALAVDTLRGDPRLGAVQGKLMRMDGSERTNRIDALGFRLERSRRLTILGHGDVDDGSRRYPFEIFGVEGAAPIFRRSAWEDCRVDGAVVDPDFRVGSIGYGDDLDIAWRLSTRGWHQACVPSARGWHDRSTTKDVGRSMAGHVSRRGVRARIPISKRRLDWSNVRFAIMKNDRLGDLLRDLPFILARECAVQGYFILFEQDVLREWGRMLRLAPRMFRKRRAIQRRRRPRLA